VLINNNADCVGYNGMIAGATMRNASAIWFTPSTNNKDAQ